MNTLPGNIGQANPEVMNTSADFDIVNSSIGNISNSVAELLSPNEKIVLNSNINEFNEILTQLESETKRISNEIGYDYSSIDYRFRITRPKEIVYNHFLFLLSEYPKLNELYSNASNLININTNNSRFLDLVFINYLEDLIFESLLQDDDNVNPDNFLDISNNLLLNILDSDLEFNKLIIENKHKELLGFDMIRLDLLSLNHIKLEKLFGLFSSLRYIHILGSSTLWTSIENISKNTIDLVFKQFSFVKEINLSNWELFKLDKHVIFSIFSSLMNVNKINLSNVELYRLNNELLTIIFTSFKQLKGIELDGTNLLLIDKIGLEIIFENLQNVRYVSLNFCKINEMSYEQLNSIFSRLGNVWNISLSFNYLGRLDDEGLRIIFSNLKNTRYIEIFDDNIDYKQEKFIRDLCPNTIFNF